MNCNMAPAEPSQGMNGLVGGMSVFSESVAWS